MVSQMGFFVLSLTSYTEGVCLSLSSCAILSFFLSSSSSTCFLEELVLSVDATWWGEPFYTSETDNKCCVAIFRHAFEAAIGNQRLVPLGMCETLTKTTTIVLPSSSSSSGENPPPLGTC